LEIDEVSGRRWCFVRLENDAPNAWTSSRALRPYKEEV
jgi:hypothetical protein